MELLFSVGPEMHNVTRIITNLIDIHAIVTNAFREGMTVTFSFFSSKDLNNHTYEPIEETSIISYARKQVYMFYSIDLPLYRSFFFLFLIPDNYLK